MGKEKWDLLIQVGIWKDDYYLETLRTEIRGLLGIIRSVNSTKIALEENIQEIAEQVEEMKILQTFPRIGGIAGATLLSKNRRYRAF